MSDEKKPTPPCSGDGASPAALTAVECSDTAKNSKNSMTETEAKNFMEEFKKTDIPFDYPPDCCYARARVMTDIMEQQGFASEKLWSEGKLNAQKSNGDPVTFPDHRGNARPVAWHYHVAPIVNVELPDGTVEKRILDPSLSDKPITVDEWKALCGVSPSETLDKITPANEHYPFSSLTSGDDYPVSEAKEKLKDHRATRNRNRFVSKNREK